MFLYFALTMLIMIAFYLMYMNQNTNLLTQLSIFADSYVAIHVRYKNGF